MDQSSIKISKNSRIPQLSIPLASSKSESNRALMLQALASEDCELHNLSSARDTQIMKSLLSSEEKKLSALDAGTVMRFMTAYLALGSKQRILTGTERMCKRPIGILVDALNEIGSEITYQAETGYPPLLINGFKEQKSNSLQIPGNISSQYISALLMIAPSLPQGIRIELIGEIYSLPYIKMTLSLMSKFGVTHVFEDNTISIESQQYKGATYEIESDWSGASYWYGIVALSEEADVKLLGLRGQSYQGDSAIVEIMEQLGVKSQFEKDGVRLIKTDHASHFKYNFKNCPDLAQTIIAIGAAKRISLEMTGLESLKIKESDRTAAMATEVAKIGAHFYPSDEYTWKLELKEDVDPSSQIEFDTYDDHRMAMALAPIAATRDIVINDPKVVRKSYPEYWDHLALAGFKIT